MNRKDYLNKRNELLAKAQELLNQGKLEEMKAVKEEIEKLDNDFETFAKEQANIKALEDKVQVADLSNQSVNVPNGAVVGATAAANPIDYETVFAKVALKRELTSEEIEVYNRFNPSNAYTHTTENTEVVIPTTVVAGIMKEAAELHPILADIRNLNIKGTVKFAKHTGIEEGDAKYYTEDQVTEDEKNTFGEITLGGHDLAKSVTVSWKLQAMAVEDFIPFLKQELGERIGAAKANAVVKGTGTNQPKGIITVLKAQSEKPQTVSYAAEIGYKELTAGMAKIASVFVSGAKIYVNNTTLWNNLANILDAQGRPIFVPDPTSGGVGRIFGKIVETEDALADGEVIIGNMAKGYVMNTQEQMKLVTDQHAKPRKTDFVAYEVNDGNVVAEKAFAYIAKNIG